jgi:hypothetical protein
MPEEAWSVFGVDPSGPKIEFQHWEARRMRWKFKSENVKVLVKRNAVGAAALN